MASADPSAAGHAAGLARYYFIPFRSVLQSLASYQIVESRKREHDPNFREIWQQKVRSLKHTTFDQLFTLMQRSGGSFLPSP